jgi:3-phenylpropionate/trans-cinnamate dioxygenase ferredoxin reductase subunit
VRTSGGREIDCDFVVVGIGVAPRVELARGAGFDVDVDDGILVDEKLQTSAPNVFAAGDVARAQHPFYGERVRLEHCSNALNQGPAAARAMLGEPTSYDRIPYFFSDQYDVRRPAHAARHRCRLTRRSPSARLRRCWRR